MEEKVRELERQVAMLNRRLAHLTAVYEYSQGSNFFKINEQVKEFGYKVVKVDAYDPRLEPLS